jgi:SAM-dependent methyltransferase
MRKSFDRVADIYDETRRMPPEAVAQVMENISAEVEPSSGVVLDLGVGTGRIAAPLAARGFQVVGVDISEKMLCRLQEKTAVPAGKIHAVRGDSASLPFADRSFTAVIAIHVFHLIENLAASTQEVRRVLSPEGRLLFGGEQRLLRHVDHALTAQFDMEDDIAAMLAEAGYHLPDQTDVERAMFKNVRSMGCDIKQLPSVTWGYETSCTDIVAHIENRIWSYLWDVPEEVTKNLAERVRDRLAENIGPPSTVIRLQRRFDMYCISF